MLETDYTNTCNYGCLIIGIILTTNLVVVHITHLF